MTDNLFEGQTAHQPTIDPNTDYFKELVGEGKKFKTEKDLAYGKMQSDLYIKHLEARLDESREDYAKLREEYEAGPKLQELLDRIKPEQLASSEQPAAKEVKLEQPAFDPKHIESLVSSKIQEHEAQRKEQQNYSQVKDKLIEKFGSNFQAAVKKHSEGLGLTEDFVNRLARTSPQAFYKTFGLEEQSRNENFIAPPPNRMRTDNFAPTSGNKRNWEYYEKMRKDRPTEYKNRETQVQMHHDAVEMGESFYA